MDVLLQDFDIGYRGFLLCVYRIRTMGLQDYYTWFTRFLYWLYRILSVFTEFLYWVYSIITFDLQDSYTWFTGL